MANVTAAGGRDLLGFPCAWTSGVGCAGVVRIDGESLEQRIQRVVREEVAIVPYDPAWVESFRAEKEAPRDDLMSETLIHRRVAAARKGENPAVITRMRSGWAVVGDHQVVHGYCLLLPDPVVGDLNALSPDARSLFLLDMTALGDALLEVTGAARINYEILGNSEPALHAHVFPRYDTEPADRRTGPVWLYDWSQARVFDRAAYATFIDAVANALSAREPG
jgi:diadenosine tetraphosphate (Ap4A) HIT family hydrolase